MLIELRRGRRPLFRRSRPWLLLAPVLLTTTVTAGGPTDPPSLQVWGALREVMHDHDLSARVALADVPVGPRAVGVGAVAGLDGEVTILDGRVWVARPDGTVSVGPAVAVEAALLAVLVGGRVREAVLSDATDSAGLDAAIAAAAEGAGIDTDLPFAFVIDGTVTDLEWHVVDGSRLEPGGGHAQHRTSGKTFRRDRTRAKLVGLFSRSHAGVFTHRDSTTHLHAILDEETPSGHVDRVALPAGTKVEFRGPD